MSWNDIRVSFFLVTRYIRGANHWTTALILFVMVLTFLNLTVIGGLLEGIIVGSLEGTRDRAIGDVYISAKEGKTYVERTQRLTAAIQNDTRVKAFSVRYGQSVEAIEETLFHAVTDKSEERPVVRSRVLGVDPTTEALVTGLDSYIIEGTYLDKRDRTGILLGRGLVQRYSPFGEDVLGDVQIGDYLYMRFSESGTFRPYRVRGIFRTKAGELDLTVLMNATEVRLVSNNPGNNANSIAVRLHRAEDAVSVRDDLLNSGFSRYASIETVEDAIGSFLNDIRILFSTLGAVVGAIGLIVASITIFIIIFVTASSRQRYIGILKGIGITPNAIRVSYVLYALFFAIVGTGIGMLALQFLLIPFFERHPLDFPFSDGILYVTPSGLLLRIALIVLATVIAGFVPSHQIVRKPAIRAIMNR